MTAKEKATEIANMFYEGSVFDYSNDEHEAEKQRAKERAVKAVQIIVDHAGTTNGIGIGSSPSVWQEVILEIKLL